MAINKFHRHSEATVFSRMIVEAITSIIMLGSHLTTAMEIVDVETPPDINLKKVNEIPFVYPIQRFLKRSPLAKIRVLGYYRPNRSSVNEPQYGFGRSYLLDFGTLHSYFNKNSRSYPASLVPYMTKSKRSSQNELGSFRSIRSFQHPGLYDSLTLQYL